MILGRVFRKGVGLGLEICQFWKCTGGKCCLNISILAVLGNNGLGVVVVVAVVRGRWVSAVW